MREYGIKGTNAFSGTFMPDRPDASTRRPIPNEMMANDVKVIPSPTLSEAMQLYLQLKGVGKAKTFHQAAMRNVGVVVDVVGDKKYNYSPGRFHRQTIRRIFNSASFDTGGRFYGGRWQNIPSAYRGLITIDGKRTAEFDFGRLRPTMLYAKKGLTLSEAAYDIGVGMADSA